MQIKSSNYIPIILFSKQHIDQKTNSMNRTKAKIKSEVIICSNANKMKLPHSDHFIVKVSSI